MNRGMQSAAVGIAILAISLCSGILSTSTSASSHYQRYHDESSLNAIFSKQVKPGEQLDRIENFLGVGSRPIGESRDAVLRALNSMNSKVPHRFPDGVHADDLIVGYETDGITQFFQFRDGRLMNHNPKDFEQPMTIYVLNPEVSSR